MKKISILLALLAAFALVFVTTACKNGEDGDNGESITSLVLRQTGNVWYNYKKTDSTNTPSYSEGSSTDTLSSIYLKYNTSTEKLVMAAVGSTYYATTEKEFSQAKWASTVTTLRALNHITKVQDQDPTTNKREITNFSNWGSFTIDHLIEALFDE